MYSKNKKIIWFVLLVLIVFGALIWFVPIKNKPVSSKPVVATTFFPLYDITRNLVPKNIEVKIILPPGASPHTFEPTPTAIANLNQAQVVYAIGYGLDDWVEAIKPATTPKIRVDQNIQLRKSVIIDEDNASPIDPHYWLTIKNAKIISVNIEQDLESRFPEYQIELRSNLAQYLLSLDQADMVIKSNLKNLTNRNLITLHDAWYYFAAEYGLTVAGTFEPAAGKEPTPQYLAALQTALSKNRTQILYSEPSVAITSLAAFVQDNKLRVIILDPAEGANGANSYIDIMKTNAQLIAQNQ